MNHSATRSLSRHLGKAFAYAVLIALSLVAAVPLFWLFTSSLKSDQQIFLHPMSLPEMSNLQWDNFSRAWTQGRFGRYFGNSVMVGLATVTLTVFASATAAYALARFRFRGSRPMLFFFLAGLMLPLQLSIVPLFFEMKWLNLLNSRIGLVTAYVAFGLPFGIFVLTGFFKTLPSSLYESALIDGAGEFRAFWSIMLPTVKPGLVTVAIFSFLGAWNEFFMAFMFLSGGDSESVRTLPLGLANLTIVSQFRSDWGMAFAGLTLMILPTLVAYCFLQAQITRGITAGAVKG